MKFAGSRHSTELICLPVWMLARK